MSDITILGRGWKERLGSLILNAKNDLLIASPYVTFVGTNFVKENLSDSLRSCGRLSIITDLSPLNICSKSTEPGALHSLTGAASISCITHLTKLHAKVYVADSLLAIVTSGNLTSGGLFQNYEYGIEISDPSTVNYIRSGITEFMTLGVPISKCQLEEYCRIGERVVSASQAQLRTAAKAARKEFEQVLRSAEDELIRFRLAGGAITTVFEKTILHLLNRQGPMATVQLHPLIQAIHHDLCDDSIDRVIDGQHFGKKWKHAVRRAQSHLKDNDEIELVNGKWRIVSSG